MSDFEIKGGIAIIKEGTRVIEASDLSGHTLIESVVIPKGVTEIEDYAFGGCTSLTTVILSSFSVGTIGKDTFNGCSALTTIYVSADMVDHYKSLLPVYLHGKIAPAGDMGWDDAIREVLVANGAPMRNMEILKEIIKQGYRLNYGDTPDISVGKYLRDNKNGWFEFVRTGVYTFVGTSVTAAHPSSTAGLTPGWAVPVDVRPSTAYAYGDSNYKMASDFIDSKVLSVLSDDEKELHELIVNFRLPLVEEDVCFADILDDLEVEFSPKTETEEAIREQSVDAALLRKKLNKLNEQIRNIVLNLNNLNDASSERMRSNLERMRSAASKAEELLRQDPDNKVKFKIKLLGKFVSDNSPKAKVVIYYKNIMDIYGARWKEVMAGVFVHEMFHAWNYSIAEKNPRSVMAIDEPMVEFETLYFLKELAAFTDSHLHGKVESVYEDRKKRVQNKQSSIGDVAAYGFGYYLFKELIKMDGESIKWIEAYSKKSASIKKVKKVEDALIPIYPFMLEAEVMQWFKKIIFDRYTTSVTAGKSAATKTWLPVSLRDLVLACIKTIGRKYFEAKELYAFAPIFKLCAAVSGNLEDTLKQQLDELVKEGVLEALSHDYYSMKLAGIEVKSMSPAPSPPTKSKGGYTRGPSIPFAVEFPDDDVVFNERTAVETFIKSLKHIGLSRVQSVGIMIQGYNLVDDNERPPRDGNKWQDYVDNKYIYTKLANSLKIKYLYQIANELGISIKIYDI